MKPLEEAIRIATPAAHKALIDWQKRTVVADERRLGPSLQDPQHADHIFRLLPDGYQFGTRVPYSMAHAKYRRERGMGDHMELDEQADAEIADAVMKAVLE
jgi:hypothetical protein